MEGRPDGPPLQRYVRLNDRSVLVSALSEQFRLLRAEILHNLLVFLELLDVHAHRIRLQNTRVVGSGAPSSSDLIDRLFDLLVGDLLRGLFVGGGERGVGVSKAGSVTILR